MQLKILIADDSAADRMIIQSMLSEHTVLTACDGIEAMKLINEQEDINLLILDLNMPNMDGFQVLEALRSERRYKSLRTIILTNHDEPENEIRGLSLGALDYIRKPINMESLKVRIDMHSELLYVQQALEAQLYEKAQAFDFILNQIPIGIAVSLGGCFILDDDGEGHIINPMFEQITGRKKEELIGLEWRAIAHPDDISDFYINLDKLRAGEIKRFTMDARLIRPDRSIIWINLIMADFTLNDTSGESYICLIKDINERKVVEAALYESERSKSIFLSHLPGLAYRCSYDKEWTMHFVSDGCYKLTGYKAESLLYNRDLSFNDLIAPEYRELLWNEWEDILKKREPFQYEYEIITAKGTKKWVLEMGEGIYNAQGEVEALEGIIIDISDRKEIDNYLRYNNEHDKWTGLYNRTYLEKLMKKDLADKPGIKRAVIGINLSPIQSLSAVYGFRYTQELTKAISDALVFLTNDRRMLFNTYENRFVFYIKQYDSTKELADFSQDIVSIIKPLLSSERIGAGIGIVEINENTSLDVDQILKDLLIASEKALSLYDGDIGYWFFDSSLEEQINREEVIKRELAKIISGDDNSGFHMMFQPIYDLKKDCVCGFEALARLHCEGLGLVPPYEFIAIAEKNKLIIPLGNVIFTQAFSFLRKIRELGYTDLFVSVNVSVNQLLKSGFSANLIELINAAEVPPEYINLEITESVFVSNYHEINLILGELSDLGIHIDIDDFGTGYSSLARVSELDVSCLKIDRYFIDMLMHIKPEKAITGDIISLAHKLGYIVVAEGVEHEKQKEYLLNNDCDRIQGYLIAKPLSTAAAINFLEKQCEVQAL
jgi:PAS domain S-box-containing protein